MTVGIVAFVSHPLPELRTALRGIRETAPPDSQLAVVATGLGDQDATYLLRQYLRGRIQALEFEHRGAHGCHCGLDNAYRLVHGDYFARVDDTFTFKPGWLETAVERAARPTPRSAASLSSRRPTTTAAAAARAPSTSSRSRWTTSTCAASSRRATWWSGTSAS